MKRLLLSLSCYLLLVTTACKQQENQINFESLPLSVQTISLLGDTLKTETQALPERLLIRIDSLSASALEEGNIVNHLIWEARKTAYEGDYRQAVQLYTDAIHEFPKDPRLYRHRGHRYITLREFDLAIKDFEQAVQLFDGMDDIVEQDGMPNDKNIPLSTLQTNTWYHLGLAHFLKGEYEQATNAYENGLSVSENNDMNVAFLYWQYMSLRKMGRDVKAGKVLEQVTPEMELLENTSYHELLMVFKGVFSPDEILSQDNSTLENATLGYGLGFWHDINGRHERAIEIWENVYNSSNWAAFGFIASEVELSRI